jgi:hypothetical protein
MGLDIFNQSQEIIDSGREDVPDAVDQHVRIIGEAEGVFRENDFRTQLRPGDKLFAGELELSEKLVQGSILFPRGRIVGHGVQSCFQEMAMPIIVGVEAAGQPVLFQDQHLPAEPRRPDAGSQAGKASADNNELIVSHRLKRTAG